MCFRDVQFIKFVNLNVSANTQASRATLHLDVSTSTLNLIKMGASRDVDIYTHLSFTTSDG